MDNTQALVSKGFMRSIQGLTTASANGKESFNHAVDLTGIRVLESSLENLRASFSLCQTPK